MTRIRCFLALLLCVLLLTPAALGDNRSGVGFFFDTVVTINLYDAPDDLMPQIWEMCETYENLLSKTVSGSDVDRINTAGGEPVKVSEETYAILTQALAVSELTGGAFCVTIAPVTALWDFTDGTCRMPSEEELARTLPLVDDSRLQLLGDCTVRLDPGMMIDLGGIAKGYIADEIAGMVRERASGGILSFGGNVYTVGQKPDGSLFGVGIRDPLGGAGDACADIRVDDTSVVTSGIYERYFTKDGVIYHHILDPVTGISAQSDLSAVTIVHDSSMLADALATACVVLGSEKALALMNDLQVPAFFVTREGAYLYTDGFDTRYQLNIRIRR